MTSPPEPLSPGHRDASAPDIRRLYLFGFLTSASYVVMRSVAVSLFLSRVGTEALPAVIAASAVTVILVAWASRWITRPFSSRAVAMGTWGALAGLTLLLEQLVHGSFHHSWPVLGALYLLVEVRGSLNTVHLISLMNEAFADRRSNRPYALVSAGAPSAGIALGLTIGFEGHLLPLSDWLLIAVLLDLVVVGVLGSGRSGSGAKGPRSITVTGAPSTGESSGPAIERSKRFRGRMSLLVAAQIVVLTLVGYQWKLAVADYFRSDELAIAEYVAFFYAGADALIVLLQFFVAGRVLDRFGATPALVLLPATLAIVGLASFGATTPLAFLLAMTIGRGSMVIRRALHDPALAATLRELDADDARDTVVFVTGFIKPAAEAAAAAIVLLGAARLSGAGLTWLWVLGTLPWMVVALRFGRSLRRERRLARAVESAG